METNTLDISLKDRMISLFEDKKDQIFKNDIKPVSALRNEAFEAFTKMGFPHTKMEKWRSTSLEETLAKDYNFRIEGAPRQTNVEKIFECEIPDFDTYMVAQLNGWYVYRKAPLRTLPNGTIVGSLAQAMQEYPELISKHYGKYADYNENGLTALNTAFAQDGIFIYVPDGVEVEKPLQMVNIIDSDENLFIQSRNLVIMGKNSKLTLLQCDDSVHHRYTFLNALTEVYVDENSTLDHYKLQNKDDSSTLINNVYLHQEANSNVTTNAITLNGGLIRNDTHVTLNGRNCTANVYGLYLVDREQHVDNHVFIDHATPDSYSNEQFKGILDDSSSAVFNGHILVRKDSQHTNAYQNNKNILLTDKATVDTQPFLEIYADDVKCSHGATVGQLDQQAMFYIRSRGISKENARMLLMYAFTAEVVNKISIENLRERIDDMVKKRLRGELSICDQCVLHCNHPEKELKFNIDMTKI
ncbi:MAG: Fe-S cluster assembly protein SufD [Bacteroidales bacterium]|nr:Fe-S cluster assembly protein SufD [Bacteroidales bacterium]